MEVVPKREEVQVTVVDEVKRAIASGETIRRGALYYTPEVKELQDEKNLSQSGEKYSPDVLYWIGYLYRYWASSRGEKSRKIYRSAPAKTMKRNYMMFHTFDPDVAIDDLIEINRQRRQSRLRTKA